MDLDGFARIREFDPIVRLGRNDTGAELLAHLTRQGLRNGLVLLDLPTREFPASAELPTGIAAGRQNPPMAVKRDRGNHDDAGGVHENFARIVFFHRLHAMKRPLIGIGPHFILSHEKSESIGCYKNYIQAVSRAGGDPLILTPYLGDKKGIARRLDGLLLQGGGDIHPRFFGAKIPKGVKLSLSPDERTTFDLAFLKEFLKLDRPVLAICLGAQTLNVLTGGDMIQDIPTQCPNARDHRKKPHPAFIHPESKLHSILKKRKIATNSYHHQSIRNVGRGLMVSAQCDDGIIEAVESTRHRFVLGLQWHPEKTADTEASRRIFGAFVKACR